MQGRRGGGQEKPRKKLESGAGVGTMPWPRKQMEPQILRLELKHKGSLLRTHPKAQLQNKQREGQRQPCTELRTLTSETLKVPSPGTRLGAEPAGAVSGSLFFSFWLTPSFQSPVPTKIASARALASAMLCGSAVHTSSFPPRRPSPEIKERGFFTFATSL
uniref:Uncharacterized protein n=1 Tax=Molossus molossus TaxID=27622 RepID=A0A7J8JVM6_MOLMO|nr:hypothetical protein HJG59_007908 [Molossus molossus]